MESGLMVEDLSVAYRDGRTVKPAVRGVSFAVPRGATVGLLGRNGAGKTTTVRAIATLLRAFEGDATVDGVSVKRDPRRVRSMIGVSFGGDSGLYPRLTGRQNLVYFADMYPRASGARDRIVSLLEMVGLTKAADLHVATYSRGMRQRLHIARCLLHDPPVLLLDEPSSGLDPEGARDLRVLVDSAVKQAGKAVLLTTHDLRECEALCDSVVVMSDGEIVQHATPRELREAAAQRLGNLVTVTQFACSVDLLAQVVARHGIEMPQEISVNGMTFYTHRPAMAVSELLALDPTMRLSVELPSLEDAYLGLVAR